MARKSAAKVKVVKTDENAVMLKELEDKLKSMKEDRDKKCKAAREQLIDMLNITSDKYRTATGVAEALRVWRFICENNISVEADIKTAKKLAFIMADVAKAMAEKAQQLQDEEMDQLCKGFYNEDLASEKSFKAEVLAEEMMRIDLCRNVGGAAEDMVSFVKRVEEEVNSTQASLDDLLKEHPELKA